MEVQGMSARGKIIRLAEQLPELHFDPNGVPWRVEVISVKTGSYLVYL